VASGRKKPTRRQDMRKGLKKLIQILAQGTREVLEKIARAA
jgi:hypothetical protein